MGPESEILKLKVSKMEHRFLVNTRTRVWPRFEGLDKKTSEGY